MRLGQMSEIDTACSVLSIVCTDVAITSRVSVFWIRDHGVAEIWVGLRILRHITCIRVIYIVRVVVLNSQDVLLDDAALFGTVRFLTVSAHATRFARECTASTALGRIASRKAERLLHQLFLGLLFQKWFHDPTIL